LAEAIRRVRKELVKGLAGGPESGLLFRAGRVELEFQVAVFEEPDAEVGVAVVSFGAAGERPRSDTHLVKLTLIPSDAAGEEVRIWAEAEPEVSAGPAVTRGIGPADEPALSGGGGEGW
jgi:hypothetical protein